MHRTFIRTFPEAHDHYEPRRAFRMLPYMIQAVLLMQCMYQALIVTMLARNAFLTFHHNWLYAAATICAIWAPTLIMTKMVTPEVSGIHTRG